MRVAPVLVIAASLCAADRCLAQFSPVRVLVTVRNNVDPVYAAPIAQGATHLVYEGERVVLSIRIDNTGETTAEFVSQRPPGLLQQDGYCEVIPIVPVRPHIT